jgi:hypothetical protein
MRRKAAIIGTLAIVLTAATSGQAPFVQRAVSSVRTIRRTFGELKQAGSMSTAERLVFSVVLANARTPVTAANAHTVGTGRT